MNFLFQTKILRTEAAPEDRESFRKNAEGKEGPTGKPIFPWTPGLEAQGRGAGSPYQLTVAARNMLKIGARCCVAARGVAKPGACGCAARCKTGPINILTGCNFQTRVSRGNAAEGESLGCEGVQGNLAAPARTVLGAAGRRVRSQPIGKGGGSAA